MAFRVLPSPVYVSFLIFIFFLFLVLANSRTQNFLPVGSSLSVEDDSDLLISPDKTFTCGFYGHGENAYWFSIWFTNSWNRTVVWMANRDRPVNGKGSRLSFRRHDGVMFLTDVDNSVIWQTESGDGGVIGAELLNSGNLVVRHRNDTVLWQSFDFPTDTLLPTQPFTKNKKLISGLGTGNYAPGYFVFFYDNDNVLKLMYNGPDITSLYWPNPDSYVFPNGRTNYNSSRIAVLDDEGRFSSSDNFHFNASDMGFGIKRRLTMDYDGNLRLYSLNNTSGTWVISWVSMKRQCSVHGACGKNGICIYAPNPKCSCPPGYEMAQPRDWTQGCKPKFKQTCSNDSQSQEFKFVELLHVDFWGFDFYYNSTTTFNFCMQQCLGDCLCEGFSYRLDGEARCFAKRILMNGLMSPDFPGSLYLKYPMNFEAPDSTLFNVIHPTCNPNDTVTLGSPSMYGSDNSKRTRWYYLYWFISVLGAIEVFFIASAWWFLFLGGHVVPSSVEDGYQAILSQFRRFSYDELKKATNKMKEELGRGGSGVVYKGVLKDERVVAVKKLNDASQGEEMFWTEVSTIGKISHMNLVRMFGFCSEKKQRLLVYEYMQNGSLDKHLFSPGIIGWKERFKIALGTAKGLGYLHHECLEWIIHCDVKPENVLLDSDFEPKISDFGLAKLFQREGNISKISLIRGTKGYLAPEWAMNLPITAKVDVYSYGIVILEMVKGIRISNWLDKEDCNEADETGLGRFIRILKRKIECGDESWVEETVDERLNGEFNMKQVAKMVEIGISCVEEDRNKRPTMKSVVEALLQCDDLSDNVHALM